ncbi:hypothetical protein HYPSUDRAFT_1103641 [Hypholoma sublateritium FD-334 SS-4]|uniref:DNA replication complex GINS protein SLD5 n=1 Tax=Hypholoma sublateritium (strain FD-334 SS-4) TaxID=945553 RepID=A0A0D2M2D9_HYPSF|nr:hypothetical protein HYPSUDRAFT_1103641 [Hypholoma sublateritium FD-334 SS-4]
MVPAPPDDREPDFLEEDVVETPLEQLTRHWMNERHAPDILPAQEALLAALLDHLRRQSDAVQLLRGDPSTSEEEHIRIMLVQTEIERVKFIVRSYVRTRLFKIERYARFITINADIQTRLTAAERDHASRHVPRSTKNLLHAKLTDQHFYLEILQSLPEKQSHLDDTPMFVPPMVTEPDTSRPVFVHALKQCPTVRLPDGATLDMKKGHVSLMPYAIVEQLVARGEVELI